MVVITACVTWLIGSKICAAPRPIAGVTMSPTTSPIDSASLTTKPKARPTVNSVTTAAAASTGPRNSGEIVVMPWTTTPSSSVSAIRKRTISGTRILSSGFRASTTGIGREWTERSADDVGDRAQGAGRVVHELVQRPRAERHRGGADRDQLGDEAHAGLVDLRRCLQHADDQTHHQGHEHH